MRKQILDLEVVSNTRLNPQHFILKLKTSQTLTEILPGQFAQVLIQDSTTFLRRPISIHDFDKINGLITMLIQIRGHGTQSLSLSKPGDLLNVILPLGKSFTITQHKMVLLVGGGCGIAPLLFLAKELHQSGNNVTILIGGKSSTHLFQLKEFEKYGTLYISTEDGSLGETGFVTSHSVISGNIQSFERIFCCGPEPMMKRVSQIAGKAAVECEVSLENTMACGIGACLCCVTETVSGNKCVCTEGPVFNTKELKWQI
jgi:dihydroorotate dehydrogenase electron transfer subunit